MARIDGDDVVEEALGIPRPARPISAHSRLAGMPTVRNSTMSASGDLCAERTPSAGSRSRLFENPSKPQQDQSRATYSTSQTHHTPTFSNASPVASHELALVPYVGSRSRIASDQILLEQQPPKFVLTNLQAMGHMQHDAPCYFREHPVALTTSYHQRSSVEDLKVVDAQDRLMTLMNSENESQSLSSARVKRRKSRRQQAWSGSIEQMTSFVEAAAAHRGQDLMIVDEELIDRASRQAECTEAVRLEADVRVSGHAGVRLPSRRGALPKAHSPGDVAASVTLSVNCRALERIYIDGANRRRRRPLIVFELGDAFIEASLQAYCRLHEEAEKHNTPIWQRPILVLTVDATSKQQLSFLATLQQQLRSLEKRAQTERSSALLDAVQSVVIIDPTLVISGVASEVSAALLRSVLKRPSASGIRLIQHLAARADSIKLRVHKQGRGDDLGVTKDLKTKDDFLRRQALVDADTQCKCPQRHSRLSINSPPASPILRKSPMSHRGLHLAAHRLVC